MAGLLVAPHRRVRGFSLLETLVALIILATALLALAPLTTMATGANGEARHLTTATLLALDKIEDLRSGVLAVSPPDTLDRNVPGFCDFFDTAGMSLPGAFAGALPAGAAFVRRWSAVPRGGPPADHTAIQVVVLPGASAAASRGASARLRGEVRLAALVARTP